MGLNKIVDEWRGNVENMNVAIRVKFDEDGNTICSRWFIENLLTEAGYYKYEENIYATKEED